VQSSSQIITTNIPTFKSLYRPDAIVVKFELFIMKFEKVQKVQKIITKLVKVRNRSSVELRQAESSSEDRTNAGIIVADFFNFVKES